MSADVIIGGIVAIVIFTAGLRLAYAMVDRIAASPPAQREGTWQYDVRLQATANRQRLVGSLYYFATAAVIGGVAFIAALARLISFGWGILGFGVAVISLSLMGARIRYASGSLVDACRVLGSWLRR